MSEQPGGTSLSKAYSTDAAGNRGGYDEVQDAGNISYSGPLADFSIDAEMLEVAGEDGVTKEDLAELFGFRCYVELDIRRIKTQMNLHQLRC
ncbi:hypothetical protein FHS27_005710 [Rhodopirellula rubra]|uniref:Uncharacterized protein n=1 Tax=Aporhodopirellula rubra TaxID=980271 RepID=A0A7W5E496_9BACT|nr:hypothetical protein [Aporhodopirellula rubra]MBB3209865.1 hypothetical protein [Aporhodopirellula rubra]